jgi:hypothetical protein
MEMALHLSVLSRWVAVARVQNMPTPVAARRIPRDRLIQKLACRYGYQRLNNDNLFKQSTRAKIERRDKHPYEEGHYIRSQPGMDNYIATFANSASNLSSIQLAMTSIDSNVASIEQTAPAAVHRVPGKGPKAF